MSWPGLLACSAMTKARSHTRSAKNLKRAIARKRAIALTRRTARLEAAGQGGEHW